MFYHFYHSIYFRKTKSTEIQAAKNHRYATPLGVRSSSSRKEVCPLPHRKPKCCAFFKCPSVAAAGAKVPKKGIKGEDPAKTRSHLTCLICLVVWNINFLFFPSYWECHHPNWLSFFRGVGWNHQPIILLSEKSIPTCSIRLGIDMDWSSRHEIWATTPS